MSKKSNKQQEKPFELSQGAMGVAMLALVAIGVLGFLLILSTPERETEGLEAPAPITAPSGQFTDRLVEICDAANTDEPATREYDAAEDVLEEGVDYRAVFCTESGPVYVDLYEAETPITVNNFVFLAQNGYYNNTTFHRVIEDFMAQGGDPTATGTGGPGYQFEDEIVPTLVFDRPGLLAMANAGPGTNGSQFFITTVATPHLNGRHTIFGEVLDGQDAVESLRLRDPQTATTEGSALNTIVIITDPAEVEGDGES